MDASLPSGFSYLAESGSCNPVDGIVESIRYSGNENVMGRPLDGYNRNVVIATDRCNEALRRVHARLLSEFGLCLVVYDAYRPRKAVEDFWGWAHLPPVASDVAAEAGGATAYNPDRMGPKYFPKFSGSRKEGDSPSEEQQTRATLFEKGYISKTSNHARGSTVDVTFVEAKRRADVRVDGQSIGVQNRRGILRSTDAPICPRVANASASDRPQMVFVPEFRPFDQLIRDFITPKLTPSQRAYITAAEEEIISGGPTIVPPTGEGHSPVGPSGIRAVDRCGSLPFVDDETVDMGTSFDLFDAASHPLWPGQFTKAAQEALAAGTGGEGEATVGNASFTSAPDSAALLKASFQANPPEVAIAHPTFLFRRLLLQCLFEEEGFEIAHEEWWHFRLVDEPFPPKADEPEFGFDFNVE